MVYGYARISTRQQNIERQIRNIKEFDSSAYIFKEAFSGRKMDRPEFNKLLNKVQEGDTIIFDSVSRMSRTSSEGLELYFDLYDKNVRLIFLKERHIDTDTFKEAVKTAIAYTGNDIADIYIEATNRVFKILAKKQIQLAFDQSQKEVDDLRDRTKEGIETARINGKTIGHPVGKKNVIKKKADRLKLIEKYKKKGTSNEDAIKLIGMSRNTYYKYLRELNL